jgi:hypothetical protein
MRLGRSIYLLLLPFAVYSQEPAKPRPSPVAIAAARYKDTYIKIVYGQPQKKGREIFGQLVPYDQVWRTGANEATEIHLTRDIKINNTDLKAGNYSLFTIPGKEKWTIIINGDLGLWGAYNYNVKSDVLRFEVPALTIAEANEAFTIQIDQKNDKADLIMAWDKTKVTAPIQFSEPKPGTPH